MKKLSKWLYKVVNIKLIIISTIIFVLFMATVAPMAANYMAKLTDDAPSPDTSFDYEAEDLIQMAEDYGVEGRKAYVTLRFTFDLVFPFVYLFFLATVITKLLSYLPLKSRFRCFNIIPFIGVVFDFMENILTATVIGMYPSKIMWAACVAPYATMIKWVFVGGSFVIIVVFGVLRLIQYFSQKESAI